jgi:hypothetical protein
MSAAPSVKRRLSKPKTNDHNTPLNLSRPKRSPSSAPKSKPPPDISPEQWTSYFDLKTRPDAPKNLKQQLKQSFPETKRKLSLDSFRRTSSDSTHSTDTMGVKDRYPPAISTANLGPNLGVKSSPMSMASPSPLARQLSVVHEGPGIDIASAIHLLQELKKTASPEELVALHRALLPMKEDLSLSQPSTPREDQAAAQTPSRRTSKLPPGLNTRGAPGDDLLRKLSDEVRRPRTSVQQTNSQESLNKARRSTSTGQSSVIRTSYDAVVEAAEGSETPSDEHEYRQTGAYRSGTLRITNGAASPDPARMLQLTMPVDVSEPVSPAAIESPACETPDTPDFFRRPIQASMESFPGPYRVLHSEKRQTSRPLPPPPASDSRRSSDASETQPQLFDQQPEEYHAQSEPTPETYETTPTPTTNEPPPFVQTHPPRLRTIPTYAGPLTVQDVSSDYEDASPRETKTAISQFATRLSTVYGEDDSEDDSPGTPNHALAKLTGETRLLGPRAPKSMQSVRSLRSPRPASMSQVDSGYGSSDASSQRYIKSPKPSDELQRPAQVEQDGDTDSLYTFNEFMKGPSNDASTPPISPAYSNMNPEHTKKDLPSFLGLREKMPVKRMSLPAGGLASSDSLASLTSSVGSESSGKVSKKLRKPMPLPERLKREKSFRVPTASEISVEEFPLVSEEMNRSLEQRFHQPPASEVDAARRASTNAETRSIWDDGSREAEVAAPVQRRNPFARKRSVSRGRKSRDRTQETTETPADAEKPGRFPFLRSLSRSRSRRRASIDSADCNTPTRRDFESAPSASGSVTPRPRLERDASVEKGNESWRTGPATKKKSKSMGMTEEMASELARSKSRDVGGHDRITAHDRPRMATPKRSMDRGREHARSPSVGVPKSGRSVEDFVPGWHSKENSPQSNGPPRPDNTRRPFSMYADSIPPMPDLPVDVAAKAARANKLMEKRKKEAFRKSADSPVGSANASVQNSAASSPNMGKVKAAVRAREQQERELEERLSQDDKSDFLRPGVRRRTTAEEISIAVRKLEGSGSEQSSILETDSRPTTANHSEVGTAVSSNSSQSQGPNTFSAFDKQAALWRERRKSLGTYLPSPVQKQREQDFGSYEVSGLMSPEIVVSRYITPLSKENAARAHANQDPTSEAARHADAYRSLLDDEDACPPSFDIPRSDSAYSSASSSATVPNYHDLPRGLLSRPPMPAQARTVSGVTNASSVYSQQYSALPRTTSPGGRVRTPSGKFYAYEPTTHASQAERSRAASLGKLQPGGRRDAAAVASDHKGTLSAASSTDGLSTIFSDTVTISSCGGTIRHKPKNPHQRHNFPESKHRRDHSRDQKSDSTPRRPRPVSSHSSNLGDRFSGGLAWEWNRESGFGGSAGTRLNNEPGTRRKGQRLAESFGVDLGDVPIFLCPSPDGLAPQQPPHRKGYFGV